LNLQHLWKPDSNLSEGFLSAVLSTSGASLISTVAGIITALAVMRWVSPKEMALWNAGSLVLVYGSIIKLGTNLGLTRQVAYHLGIGQDEEAKKLSGASFAWSLLLSGISLPLVILFVHRTLGGISSPDSSRAMTILAVTITFIISLFRGHFEALYRASSEFIALSKINVVLAVVGLLLLFLVWRLKFQGVLVRYMFLAVIGVAIIWFWSPLKSKARFSFQSLRILMMIGGPLFVLQYLQSLLGVLDRTVLLSSDYAMGLLTLPMLVKRASAGLVAGASQVSFAFLSRAQGVVSTLDEQVDLLFRSVAFMVAGGLVFAILGWLLLPIVVPLVIPKYEDAVEAAKWVTLWPLASAGGVTGNYLRALNRPWWLLISCAVFLGAFTLSWSQAHDQANALTSLLAAEKSLIFGAGAYSAVTLGIVFTHIYSRRRKNED